MLWGLTGWWQRLPKWLKIASIVSASLVVVQFVYPANRPLPLARVDDQFVGFADEGAVKKQLFETYKTAQLTTHVRGSTTTVAADAAGIVPDTDRLVAQLTDYPWWLRLVPLSGVVKGATTNLNVITTTSSDAFTVYASERRKECEVEPKNAGVSVSNGVVALDPAATGETCSTESMRSQLLAVPLSTKRTAEVTVKTTVVTPERTDDEVTGVLERVKHIVSAPLEVEVAGKVYAPDKSTVASWLTFPENSETKELEVGVNDDTVKVYLGTIQKQVYVAPGVTTITTFDGRETGRTPGANGRGIDLDATTPKLRTALLTSGGRVAAELSALPPTVRYVRSYSNTPAGLQALVTDAVAGKNMAISVRRLGDSGVSANGDKQYHPASTYKLFVAFSVLKRIDNGSFSWGASATNGQTISQCFDNMIVNSDNTCAEWFGATIGWGAVEADARSVGATRTTFTKTATFLSTANDLATFLQKLEANHVGLSEPSRARLLDAMKRQRYRQGIPAGVGTAVADKVGFLEAKLHDAAIVYAPSGVYVLVIMSDGSSWAEIASVAARVNQQMSR